MVEKLQEIRGNEIKQQTRNTFLYATDQHVRACE